MTDRKTQQPTVTITADTSRFSEAYERLLDKMPPRDQWLAKIRSNPSDWQAMLVFADWLELEEGDLLAAEQWRWIACVAIGLPPDGIAIRNLLGFWPKECFIKPALFPRELENGAKHNIRCMPHYPLTIEDVQAYLETAQ